MKLFKTESSHNMTAALLSHGDYNVIRVDWGNGSLTLPDKAMANTEVVGEEIAHFVNTLKENLNLNASKCHCIGHSMGGYVCGFAGQRIDKLGRISGLDPGFVRFFHVDNNKTLDPSDATFVDVYHTGFSLLNIAPSLAFVRPLGHIDIYLNNGEQQPGCQISVQSLLDTNNNIEDYFLDYFINEAVCGHFRIITYYIESILNSSCQWVAYECPSYERFKRGECATCGDDNSKCAFLGLRASEYADKTRENVMLYIETAPEPPFCVQHYVVNISTGINCTRTDHEDTVKRLFTNHVKVGQITSVKLTWESYLSYLLGLILNSYTLGVNSIKISPLTFYPERCVADTTPKP
ncbi:Pancreatic lipase-related protein 3, partial [Armadillidium vulgare]